MVTPQKSIQNHVWRMIFIPTLTVVLLIGISLAWVLISQLNEHLNTRGQVYAEQVARLILPSIKARNLNETRELIKIANEELFVRAIHVSVAEGRRNLHQGPQFILSDIDISGYTELAASKFVQPLQAATFQTLRFSHPIHDPETHTAIGWVEVEFISTPYQLIKSQTLAFAFICILLGLIIASYLSYSLYTKIVKPLASIKTKVGRMAKGYLEERIEEQKISEFQNVADSINLMADTLSRSQQNMQSHVDAALAELQETLETIEVQNVQLDIARKEALEASRIKSEFLANTSHEIRTPLNGILGFLNLLSKSDINKKQRDYVETIRDSSQHLLTVINGILDFSKIEAGKLTLDYAPVDIQRCVDDVFHLLAPHADEKNIQLINYIDANIPPHLLGDSLRLKQIFTNLINNAIKYSLSGHIIVTVDCTQKTESSISVKVQVIDEGVGLNKKEQESLFEPFTQIDSANNRKYDGTGLGLAICKGLVERMQGVIGIESEPNKGSIFWFTATFGIDKIKSEAPVIHELLTVKMLVCGKDEPSRKQICQISEQQKATVVAIETIHDCFNVLRNAAIQGHPFNILLLDLAPDERKIPPTLLSSLTEQIHHEFGCQTLVCCSQTQQRIYTDHITHSHIGFIPKPIYHEQFFTAVTRKLHIRSEHLPSINQQQPSAATVLLVDDNPANLHLASELLKGLGITVVAAASGAEAIDAFAAQVFDVVFMDIQMPGLDGIETTKILREQEGSTRRTPIIALTAHSITDSKKDLLIAGMDDCLSKPIDEAQLAHTLNRWLRHTSSAFTTPIVHDTNASPLIALAPKADFVDDELEPVDINLSVKLANHKRELAADMLNALLATLDNDLNNIHHYVQQQNYDDFENAIHRLYGSSCYCGVPTLKAITGTMDRLCHNKQHGEASEMLNDLNDAIVDILQWSEGRDIAELFKEPA